MVPFRDGRQRATQTLEEEAPNMASAPDGEWVDYDYASLDMEGRLGAINALVSQLTKKPRFSCVFWISLFVLILVFKTR